MALVGKEVILKEDLGDFITASYSEENPGLDHGHYFVTTWNDITLGKDMLEETSLVTTQIAVAPASAFLSNKTYPTPEEIENMMTPVKTISNRYIIPAETPITNVEIKADEIISLIEEALYAD